MPRKPGPSARPGSIEIITQGPSLAGQLAAHSGPARVVHARSGSARCDQHPAAMVVASVVASERMIDRCSFDRQILGGARNLDAGRVVGLRA